MSLTTKSLFALALAGSLSACGGGSVETVAAVTGMETSIITEYDTNNDGFISTDEAIAAWGSLSPTEQAAFAAEAGYTVEFVEAQIAIAEAAAQAAIDAANAQIAAEMAAEAAAQAAAAQAEAEALALAEAEALALAEAEALALAEAEALALAEAALAAAEAAAQAEAVAQAEADAIALALAEAEAAAQAEAVAQAEADAIALAEAEAAAEATAEAAALAEAEAAALAAAEAAALAAAEAAAQALAEAEAATEAAALAAAEAAALAAAEAAAQAAVAQAEAEAATLAAAEAAALAAIAQAEADAAAAAIAWATGINYTTGTASTSTIAQNFATIANKVQLIDNVKDAIVGLSTQYGVSSLNANTAIDVWNFVLGTGGIQAVSIYDTNNDYIVDATDTASLNTLYNNIGTHAGTISLAYSTLNVTGLEEAHAAGWNGEGVNIEVVDSGAHGLEVTLTAASVAPGAGINYWNSAYGTYAYSSSNGTTPDIKNYSYGFDTLAANITEFQTEVNWAPNALHIMAGPNSSTANCHGSSTDVCDTAVMSISLGYVTGEWLFVGAWGEDYVSPAAGYDTNVTDNFLVADGVGIAGTIGTSFAAPKVAGAAALVMQKFPNVNAGQTADILLNTADDTFSGYSTYQHGQGLLDVGAALSPVGDIN